MTPKEIQALVSLIDDEDEAIFRQIRDKIITLGDNIIPYLEDYWEKSFNPLAQERIEDLVHSLQFNQVVERLRYWKENNSNDIIEGFWAIATYQYPDIELEEIRSKLDQHYFEAWVNHDPDKHPIDKIKDLNEVIFTKLKFSANTKNFHNPANSMINVVLDTKKGNPLTLCAIYMYISQKLGMPVHGVNLPNLFVLLYKEENFETYINAFNKGLLFSRADIDHYLQHINLKPNEAFYNPANNQDIIKRAIRNLIISFEKLGEMEKVDELNKLMALFEA